VPGPDDIPHEALKKAIKADEDGNFITALHQLYNASLYLGYYPKHCRHSTTVPLRKDGKKEDTPKPYRPIALPNTISETLESIMAERLHYMAETEGTLPRTHLGGRKGTQRHSPSTLWWKRYTGHGIKGTQRRFCRSTSQGPSTTYRTIAWSTS